MRFEEAYYYKILIMSGLNDGFDDWLNKLLEEEEPLSDIVLRLASCGSDINKTISCLHNYCLGQEFDEKAVCEKLRLFLKDAYHSGRLSKDEVVFYMSRFCINHGDLSNYDMRSWGSMFYMDDYYSFAKEGLIAWKQFDFAFLSYLDTGSSMALDGFWEHRGGTQKSLLRKIMEFFIKK